MRTLAHPRLLALALLGAAALACTPNFQSQDVVVDLRVLAVRAEPPEAVFDADAGTVEDVTVTALFADPAAGPLQKATLIAEACAPTDDGVCQPPTLPLTHQLGPVGEQSFDVSVPPQLIQAALESDALKGVGGIEVQVSLTVETADPAGPQAASKLLVYSKKDPAHVVNHSPELLGLRLIKDNVPVGEWHPGDTLTLPVDTVLGIRPLLADGSIETFTTTDFSGNTLTLRENVAHSFFMTVNGDLDRGGYSEPLEGVGDPPSGFVRIHALKAGATGTFWVVTRDGRGGTSWLVVPWVAGST